MAAHSSLTGADLHECKGFDTATAGKVRITDGAGGAIMANPVVLVVEMVDVTTAEAVYCVIPWNCTVTKISSVISNAFITANCVVTASNHAGSSMGTITITQSGSAAGDIDTLSPSSNNTFTAGERIKLLSDGGGATATRCVFTIELKITS